MKTSIQPTQLFRNDLRGTGGTAFRPPNALAQAIPAGGVRNLQIPGCVFSVFRFCKVERAGVAASIVRTLRPAKLEKLSNYAP